MAEILISRIRLDGETQSRVTMNEDVIAEYAEAMKDKKVFPPIVVFQEHEDFWLAHGFHRVAAAKLAGLKRLPVDLKQGSLADAQWYSFSVNKTHGLRRTNEDKRKAVEGALTHENGTGKTDNAIAEHCGVSTMTVSRIREELESRGTLLHVTKRLGRDGKVYDTEKQKKSNQARAKKTTTATLSEMPAAHVTPDVVAAFDDSATKGQKTAVVLEPEVYRDSLGRVVPEHVVPAFELLPTILGDIRQKLIAAKTMWETFERNLRQYPDAPVLYKAFYAANLRMSELPQLIMALNLTLPFTSCVYCKGEGPCTACSEARWITQYQYEEAPEEIKPEGSLTFREFQIKHGYHKEGPTDAA